MLTHTAEDYEGTDTHKFIDRLINSKRGPLLIITPFISPFYAKMLLNESKKKKVYLIISASEINKGAEKLLKGKRVGRHAKALAYLFILAAAMFYLHIFEFAMVAAVAFAVVLVLMLLNLAKKSGVQLKVVGSPFIHEKLYIAEKEAITGSANLTYGGTHKNLEHIEIIHDEAEVRRLEEHFWKVWGNAKLAYGRGVAF
ncbi:MAG: phospholipase D-like domain-containing protein [Candidatus Micrarchaeaceae archaeon]